MRRNRRRKSEFSSAVDKLAGQSLPLTVKDAKENFSQTVKAEFDNSTESYDVEYGVKKFLEWVASGKPEIRIYTASPLHAKVYLTRAAEEITLNVDSVITGSSNFSKAGLITNLEFNVELKDYADIKFVRDKFEELREQGAPVSEQYVEVIENQTWLKSDISPYEIYLKTLYEFFKEEINADKEYSVENLLPENFIRLQYQPYAVVQAKKILEAYGGVFISDVVGLGKTYICALPAKLLDKGRKLIICPPVLVGQWLWRVV